MLIAILRHNRVTHQLAEIVANLCTRTTCRVRASEGLSEEFEVISRVRQGYVRQGCVRQGYVRQGCVRQGCVLSPMLFNCCTDHILREAIEMSVGRLQIEYNTSEGLFLTYRDKAPLSA